MSMGKRRHVGGAEEDAFCKWCRKYLITMSRAGYRSEIKTKARRRKQHEARREIRRDYFGQD